MFTLEQELLLSIDVTYSDYMQWWGWKVCNLHSPVGIVERMYVGDNYHGFSLDEELNYMNDRLNEHNHKYVLLEKF